MKAKSKKVVFLMFCLLFGLSIKYPDLFALIVIVAILSCLAICASSKERYPPQDFIGSGFYVPDLEQIVAQLEAESAQELDKHGFHYGSFKKN
jgi:hypothetical protein